jgi:hypothetical protein
MCETPGQTAEEIIRRKFASAGNPAVIPLMKGGKAFQATLTAAGIEVDNLRAEKLLPWTVFETAWQLLRENGGSAALRGNAMGFRLGDDELPLNSVEGRVAHRVYGKVPGDSVFRRVSPIAAIMVWAEMCTSANKRLSLVAKQGNINAM